MLKLALVMFLALWTAFGCTTATETQSKLQADLATVDALVWMYEHQSDEERASWDTWSVNDKVLDALAEIGEPAVPWLVGKLQHGDAKEREQVLRAFHDMGPAAKAAVPALIEAARVEQDTRVKLFIPWALGSIQRRVPK